ncbi:hypothetical protein [Pseudomonas sp. MH10]|uniref:hypothetical protein n=1 Tax=Pseudomonas sp. MH10 TaxID=3048627 RepID=UPI002AC965B4|nr:hypothetical protein [Pseudomonas sp. MH10]WPX63378.1 hypothetical protein RHM59_21180 [Pseudomonas sp. MH10]
MTLSLASQLPQRFGSGQEQRVAAFANEFAPTEIAINLYDSLTQTTASSRKSRGSRLACEEAHHHAADFSRKTWFACNDAFVGKPHRDSGLVRNSASRPSRMNSLLQRFAIKPYDSLTQTTASSRKSRGSRLACEEAHHHAADFS